MHIGPFFPRATLSLSIGFVSATFAHAQVLGPATSSFYAGIFGQNSADINTSFYPTAETAEYPVPYVVGGPDIFAMGAAFSSNTPSGSSLALIETSSQWMPANTSVIAAGAFAFEFMVASATDGPVSVNLTGDDWNQLEASSNSSQGWEWTTISPLNGNFVYSDLLAGSGTGPFEHQINQALNLYTNTVYIVSTGAFAAVDSFDETATAHVYMLPDADLSLPQSALDAGDTLIFNVEPAAVPEPSSTALAGSFVLTTAIVLKRRFLRSSKMAN